MLTESTPRTQRRRQTEGTTLPRLVGQDLEVPLASGEACTYVNLDMAASTPAMEPVADAVIEFLPWYSSVHRGAGFASQVSTRAYEAARAAVATFVGARSTDTVIFVRNTTEAINLLGHCLVLRPGHAVLSTIVEHHANMLPWRRIANVDLLDAPESPEQLLADLRRALEDRHRPIGVVAITGASNVTGEVFPITEIGTLAHEYGALLCVDAAQLAPHRAIDMVAMGIDFLALSGHKMYAPFGCGVLVAPTAVMGDAEPMLAGGGAVAYVTTDDVQWASLPDRHEAGSPNVVGAIALGTACTVLGRTGMAHIGAHEKRLLAYLDGQINEIPKLHRLRLWDGPDVDRLGVSTFTVDGMHHALVASVLSAEYAIGVRHGCFCAHPYITHLLGVSIGEAHTIRERLRRGEHQEIPGAIRASFGIGTTVEHIDRLIAALREITTTGPHLKYVEDPHTGDYLPVGDRRTLPSFEFLPPLEAMATPSGCGQF